MIFIAKQTLKRNFSLFPEEIKAMLGIKTVSSSEPKPINVVAFITHLIQILPASLVPYKVLVV